MAAAAAPQSRAGDAWTVRRATLVATYYALHLLPAAASWQQIGVRAQAAAGGTDLLPAALLLPPWTVFLLWLASAVWVATALRWLWERGGVLQRVAAMALNVLTALASVLLMISLVVQGTFVNARFFFHADWATIVVASRTFGPLFFVLWAYWLAAGAWLGLLPRAGRARRRGDAALGLVALAIVLNGPMLSIVWYAAGEMAAMRRALLVPKPSRSTIAVTPIERPTDLIFVFAEALEQTFADPRVFGADVTPRLTALAREGLRFADLRQVSGVGWTTGAVIAAQCALRFGPAAHGATVFGLFGVEARVPDAVCLGDVLSAHGYRTVFMGGAPLAFGHKEAFLAAHGFAERHGLKSLRPLLADPNYVSGWGIFDDSLFAIALDRLAELEGDDAPFALMLLTLDLHVPDGFPSASCGSRDARQAGAGKLFVVRCADRLLADFIDTVRDRHPAALIVLLSDHLVPFDSALSRRLAPFEAERRLRFVAWGADVMPGVLDEPGTHFDVGPTVLDLLDIPGWTQHNLGASLLRHDSPWFARKRPQSLTVVHTLPALRLASGDAVTFDPVGPTIEIGDVRLLATGNGLALNEAVFAIAWTVTGIDAEVRHFSGPEAYEALTSWVAGRSALGVSTQPTFNSRVLAGTAASAVFFVGGLGGADQSTLVAEPLHSRRTAALP